ncbi:MAG: hypothetical protein ABDH21_04465 [bacterium]
MSLDNFINYQKMLIKIKTVVGTVFFIPFFTLTAITLTAYFWDTDYYKNHYFHEFGKVICICSTSLPFLVSIILFIKISIHENYTKLKYHILKEITNTQNVQILPWDDLNIEDQVSIIKTFYLHLDDLTKSLNLNPKLKNCAYTALRYLSRCIPDKDLDIPIQTESFVKEPISINDVVLVQVIKDFLKAIAINATLNTKETISFILLNPDMDRTYQKLEIVYTPNSTPSPFFYNEVFIDGIVNHYKEIAWILKKFGF